MTPFERIITRLIKELLTENESIAVFEDNFEKARRANDQEKMHYINAEANAYRKKIAFVKELLGELIK